MPVLVQTLIQICLFRAKPQDLPASNRLLIASAIVTLILFLIRNNQLAENVNVIGISITQVLLLGLGLKILLTLFSKPERWLQSAIALFGCSAVLLLTILPFIVMAGGDISGDGSTLSRIAIIVASLWYFSIFVYIFRETLDVSTALAFVIALVLELSFATILIMLFGSQIL